MVALHSHNYYEMYFLLEGKRQILFENKITELEEGSVAIIPPFTMHKTEGSTFVRVNVCFPQEALSEISRETIVGLSRRSYLHFKAEDFGKIKDTLYELLSLEESAERGTVEHKRILAEYLIYLVARYGEERGEDDFVTSDRMPTTLLHVLQYINLHFHEKITLSEMSERFFLSGVTLCHYFKKYLGVTFLDYLSALRIAKAKELLATTKKGMDEIASEVGLGSANYFGMFFKKAVGISPLRFRKIL